MTLAPGSRLGPYEILSPIGAGGMGEVYRAKDTRLERHVAVKVLSARFAADEEMRERFEREARAISQLSHPNICSIFDVGSDAGTAYLVMELLEGESLAERLDRGPLPPSQALRIGRDVCAALAAAHRKGIVHRDLKPANIFLSGSGTKLLDFGLAKLRERVEAGEQSKLPTEEASPLTGAGTVLGTLAYMAPEQLEGRPADARTDIFALGSVLFEVVTGRRPFTGDTPTAIIAAILTSEPPVVSTLRVLTPPSLDRTVRTCLAKNPEERWQSAADLGRELAWIESEGSGPRGMAPARARRGAGWRERLTWAGVLVLAAVLAVVAGRRSRTGPVSRAMRFSVPLPPGTTYSPDEVSRGFAVSPDGTQLVIEAVSKGGRRLFIRALDSERAIELEGTDEAGSPFWSPDSRFIAFFAHGKLRKVPAAGGAPEDLCEALNDRVGTWNPDGTILFSHQGPTGLVIYRVSDKGGAAVPITVLDNALGETGHGWPFFLPDGRQFLFSVRLREVGGVRRSRELRGSSLDSKVNRLVARLESRAEYVPTGALLFVRDAALYSQPFDARKAELSGEPRVVAENVRCFLSPGHAAFSVSQTGVIAYEVASMPSRLVWLDREGKETGALGQPAVVRGLRIAPQGGKVAVALEDRRVGSSDIWIFDPALGVSTRLHFDSVDEKAPVFTLDGSRIVYRSDRIAAPDIYEMAIDTPGSERPLLELPGVQQPEDFSHDGRFLVFTSDVRATSSDIWLLPLTGDRKPVPWLRTRFRQTAPRFSPDGRWIAYESNESGDAEIYMALTEGGGEKRRLSPAGGRQPRWRRDGRELFYIAPDGSVMAVAVAPGPQSKAGAPARLFHFEMEIERYDVTPDGSRFLVSTPVDRVRESPLRVIVNWPALMEKGR
jgi:Tol biopolymer transport system component